MVNKAKQMEAAMRSALVYIANTASEQCERENHEDALRIISHSCHIISQAIADRMDWANLTEKQCEAYGFVRRDKTSGVWLIPAWLRFAIPDDLKLISQDDGDIVLGKDADKTPLFGLLAYGIKPRK